MPLTAQQIVTLACQDAKCPGFTSQGGQFLNAALQDYCQNYDLEAALGLFNFSFNSATGSGSGPYTLPADYLRTRVQDGKDEFFYTINGVPYPLIQCTLTEFDWMVQTPGFQNFPYYYATDLTTSPPTMKVWPPASGSYPCTLRYFRLMPDIVTPETSATVPWFNNTMILQRDVAGRLMGITGDDRQAAYLGGDEEHHPLGVGTLMRRYLKNVEDREGAVHTVGRDRRRWGRSFDLLKNTKTIGWLLPFLIACCFYFTSPEQAHANCATPCTKAQITTDINTNWPDNTTQQITPALLRSTVLDLVNSYLDVNGASTFTCSTHQFLTSIATLSSYSCAQPAFTDLSGSIAVGQIPNNLITYAQESQAATNTVTGNATSGTANKTDLAVPSCSASGNVLQWTTNTGFGCVTQSFNGRTGAVIPATGDYTLNQIYNCTLNPQGRLTFLTGTPVQTATTSGATSHFYTPYLGQQVPIWDGSRFSCFDTGGELTQTAADTTKSPAAVAANSCYDVFVWNDSGTIRATRGPAWTNVTTRSAGTALTRIKGILVNNASITNGPTATAGTYVGTECSNGSSTFDWILGASASGGTAASFNVWNQYNRVDVTTDVTDNGAAYTYASATIRQARASAGNQITFVSGNPEDGIIAAYDAFSTTPATAANGVMTGIGFDNTAAYGCQPFSTFAATAVATSAGGTVTCAFVPQTGRHVISANESDSSVNTGTFDNQNALNSLGNNNLLSFKFRM